MSLENRYEFVLLFDVQDGNPNGDPDAGNLPRVDAETNNGLVTDVCLKRKVRNYVQVSQGNADGFDIFVRSKSILNQSIDKAYLAVGLDPAKAKEANKDKKKQFTPERRAEILKAQNFMCKNFFDIRTFGAVLSTGANAGQVRGPVQMTFARSIDPVLSSEHSITRVAVTSEDDANSKETEMGRKFTLPYALYREQGFVNPFFADQTGFSDDDLAVFWDALVRMFDIDRSAARGLMATRKLVIFKHASKLGNAPAHVLFDAVKVTRKPGIEFPRSFADYTVSIDHSSIPAGVEVIEM
jgi:CRISPR-associated protein Csd2